jgi:hypothetical protein
MPNTPEIAAVISVAARMTATTDEDIAGKMEPGKAGESKRERNRAALIT